MTLKNMTSLADKYLKQSDVNNLVDPIGVKYLSYVVENDWGTTWLTDHPIDTPSEETFEWLEVLKSVENTDGKFVFVELGAGFGRWALRAYKACLFNNINPKNIKLIVAEAEPQHVVWLNEHLAHNEVPANSYILTDALVSNYNGVGELLVHGPEGLAGTHTAKNWYGQSQTNSSNSEEILIKDIYLGKELLVDKQGRGKVVCDTLTIESILEQVEVVDLIDIDIQGTEVIAIKHSLQAINEKVKKLYIGTHSRQIDNELLKIMSDIGWTKIYAYPCFSTCETEFGEITFQDGVQVWVNPKFK